MKIAERITDTHMYFWGGIFSQWYKTSFTNVGGVIFNCAEQYMMWEKANMMKNSAFADKILSIKNPRKQKELGRAIPDFDAKKWDEIKFEIVVKGNILKFEQNPELKEILLSSENKILVEASPLDKVWGIGLHWEDDRVLDESKWQGENLLGEVIMEARKIIQKIQKIKNEYMS